jgi:hypothetical protein
MDFIVEILSLKNIMKRVFGIILTSYLCEKYPIKRCVELAQHAIRKTQEFGIFGNGSVSIESREASFLCVDPLIRIAKTFPFLSLESVQSLQEIKLNFKEDFELIKFIDDNIEKLNF